MPLGWAPALRGAFERATLERSLEAYRSFDPAGWVSAYKLLPMWAGIVLIVLGVAMLMFGGGKLFRLVAGPLGAAIGYLWAPLLAGRFGIALQDAPLAYAGAAFLAVMGFVFPPGLVFFAVGVPVGLVAGQLAGSDWLLGFTPACFLSGLLAAMAHRVIACVVASALGGWLLVLGMLAALHRVGSLMSMAAQQPWGVIIAALLFALAGSIYQLAVRPSPEEAEQISIEKAEARQRKRERKDAEKRWEKYAEKTAKKKK